jgi:hypothetical protein
MSELSSNDFVLTVMTQDPIFDGAQLAAAAFLARYSGRTLDAYRYDLPPGRPGRRSPCGSEDHDGL